jgi:transposase
VPTRLHRLTYCPECLKKQQQIDRLQQEIVRLKAKLRYQERTAQEGFFGSNTPSSKVPVKPNRASSPARPPGGRPGHPGHGRKTIAPAEADRVEPLAAPDRCPCCGTGLVHKGYKSRTVVEAQPPRLETVSYRLEQKYCPRCQRTVSARAPGVLPKALFGNRLLAYLAVEHYLRGSTLGHLQRQFGLCYGSLCQALRQLARRLEAIPRGLLREFRRAPVKHADETGWRTDGRNGYAWIFCTEWLTLFRFRRSRSAQVPQEVFGSRPLPGRLVVDRYGAYNRVRCAIQYCYSHLKRTVEDLAKQFPEAAEVQRFVTTFVPLLSSAIRLRSLPISDAEFRRRARGLKQQIVAVAQEPAQHPAVQDVQNLFREKADRLYQWAEDRRVPADNNRAERELRPLVIARKVSFGSQSEEGAHTREVLMSVLHTLQKRTPDVREAFEKLLDELAENPDRDPYQLLGAFDSS